MLKIISVLFTIPNAMQCCIISCHPILGNNTMQKHQHMFGSGVIFFQNTFDTMDMEELTAVSFLS